MTHRYFILDKFNTWADWHCTLTAKDIPDAEPKTNYVNIEGAHGTLDLTEALAGGPVYSDRTISASFMCSEGDHKERETLLREIRKALHGRKIQIIEPDDPTHYFLGRVKIKASMNHMAYLEFTIEAVCDPWRYAVNETNRVVNSLEDVTTSIVLHNYGIKVLRPTLRVVGTGSGAVAITCRGVTTELGDGSYYMDTVKLAPGANVVEITGAGVVTFIYREADL